MKTMKKWGIWMLVCCMSIVLSSCSGKEKQEEEAQFTRTEWIKMINDRFGFYGYQQAEPYYENVQPSHDYYDCIQAAREWNVLPEAHTLDLEGEVTKYYVSETLMGAAGLKGDLHGEALVEEALHQSIVEFRYKGERSNDDVLTKEEAQDCLELAAAFANHQEFEPTSSLKAAEGITDFSKEPEQNFAYGAGFVTMPKELAESIKQGDRILLPTAGEDAIKAFGKEHAGFDDQLSSVTGVEVLGKGNEADDMVTVEISEPKPLEQYIEQLQASGTAAVNLADCDIYDGEGNLIKKGSSSASSMGYQGEHATRNARYSNDRYQADQMAKNSESISLNVDGVTVTGTVGEQGLSLKVHGELAKKSKGSLQYEAEYSIKDIKASANVDMSWLKLKSAFVRVDYTTEEVLKLDGSYSSSKAIASTNRKEASDAMDLEDPKSIANKFNEDVKKELREASTEMASKKFKILQIPVAEYGLASVNINVNLVISASGTATITFTESNGYGVAYKGGNVRMIHDHTNDADAEIQGKVEGGLDVGLELQALKNLNVAGASFTGGLGAKVDVTAHLIDQKRHECDRLEGAFNQDLANTLLSATGTSDLSVETCADLQTYYFVRAQLDHDSMLFSLMEKVSGVELGGAKDLLGGEKNGLIGALSGHWEDGASVEACTRTYESYIEEEKAEKEEEAIIQNEMLDIDHYSLSLDVGGTKTLKIKSLPKGYEKADVTFETSDASVATIDPSGHIKAVSPGTATITVQTSDHAYKMSCLIVIFDESKSEFQPLKDMRYTKDLLPIEL